ncbi:hypothetical protein, partial [uncultured Rikenella sp.]|uniref:hypothetical protein n=1 Tax=uncultured Rikenella sp. TaxID=368003 RepID=UPI0026138CF0
STRRNRFPATSLLSFLVAQERKCLRDMSGEAKTKSPPGRRAAKKFFYKEQKPRQKSSVEP